ncbi:hypothetical protein ACP26L_06150 [Paenibacillus sp. S-38]|uniref:hypothetical protein n=1 Tax=Paenibacillus sp. S-38 TaxID=3416710 RepID=UPI003CF481A6
MTIFKKVFSTSILAAALLMGAQSAFASDGIADSRSTATLLPIDSAAVGTISDSTDVDYFYWTNNTGSDVSWGEITLYPGSRNYDIEFTHVMSKYNNYEYSFVGDDHGVGLSDQVGVSPIYAGDTVYFKIYGHDSSQYGTQPYTISFTR